MIPVRPGDRPITGSDGSPLEIAQRRLRQELSSSLSRFLSCWLKSEIQRHWTPDVAAVLVEKYCQKESPK